MSCVQPTKLDLTALLSTFFNKAALSLGQVVSLQHRIGDSLPTKFKAADPTSPTWQAYIGIAVMKKVATFEIPERLHGDRSVHAYASSIWGHICLPIDGVSSCHLLEHSNRT